MTKITEHAPGLLGDEQLILSKLVCSRSMLGKLNPSVQALSSVCYVNAMVKYHRRKFDNRGVLLPLLVNPVPAHLLPRVRVQLRTLHLRTPLHLLALKSKSRHPEQQL